ncbi:MAG: hypothetical protein IPL39_15925 [Opitutaceae bacterium]|nr:hypothetical protein [Opitutaceae bacterium]
MLARLEDSRALGGTGLGNALGTEALTSLPGAGFANALGGTTIAGFGAGGGTAAVDLAAGAEATTGAAGVGAGAAGRSSAVNVFTSSADGSTYWFAIRLNRVGSMPACRAVSVNARTLRFSANAVSNQSSMFVLGVSRRKG